MNAYAQVVALHVAGDPIAPRSPRRAAELGLDGDFLIDLLLKTMRRLGLERSGEVGEALRVETSVADELIELAQDAGLLESVLQLGASPAAEARYALTDAGRAQAEAAQAQCAYHGPVPVGLDAYTRQVAAQSICNESLTRAGLHEALSALTLPSETLDRLGPAANSDGAILLYGPPGNGKSSIARAIGEAFAGTVYIPHALAVDRQVITLFDPAVHTPVVDGEDPEGLRAGPGRAPAHDRRFVACLRPVIRTGAQLTSGRLEPSRNTDTGVHDAPLQLKAAGGVLVIDDLGRQRESAQALIDRLTAPLERGEDELALHTGRRFRIPVDLLAVFVTARPPGDLADAAAMRRLRHKIPVRQPEPELYVRLFNRTARELGFKPNKGITAFVMDELYGGTEGAELAAFHPRFLLDQVAATAAYEGSAPRLSRALLQRAWESLYPAG